MRLAYSFGGELMLQPPSNDRIGEAIFSADGVYRWILTRNMGGARPLVICGLNPSTADASKPDRTISKECGFAKRWGYTWLIKVNAYGFKETKPALMWKAAKAGTDIVGALNDAAIAFAARLAREHDGRFFVAWGGHAKRERVEQIVKLLDGTPLWCFARNDDGSPGHPLYLSWETQPQPWTAPAVPA
jgi:hypothetical protein